MTKNRNGQVFFSCLRPKNLTIRLKAKFGLSLMGALLGIFLLPKVAFLSVISPEKIIELTNLERQAENLDILVVNSQLTAAAQAKARDILTTQTFNHTLNDRKFSAWIRDVAYEYSYVGENLAIDFLTSEGVMAAWNNSAAHKKNLLSPYYSEIGLAAIQGEFDGQGTTVVVQIFGAPRGYLKEKTLADLTPTYPRTLQYLDLTSASFNRAENLFALIQPILSDFKPNNFVVQPLSYGRPNYDSIIFAFFSLLYLLAFIYFSRHYRVGRLTFNK